MIKEDYVSFEAARLLKEKGFNYDCLNYYSADGYRTDNKRDFLDDFSYKFGSEIKCPTLQMAMKWLREKHNIYISIQPDFPSELNYKMYWCWSVSILQENAISLKRYQTYIETYEQATEAAIKYCLEYLI